MLSAIWLFNIGFLPVRIWDILDILIVGYLMFQIYKLLKGSIAFNIFIGVVLLYIIWWLVGALKMDLLSLILGQFVSVGVIILIIIFQPEVRRFLLFLGNSTLKGRLSFLKTLAGKHWSSDEQQSIEVQSIKNALLVLSEQKTGALLLLTDQLNILQFGNSGVILDAAISESLLLSIFNKESPLHDGAVVILNKKIHAASCVLPISDNPYIPQWAGLRHRAAIGITESSSVSAFVVSEENGKISFSQQGRLLADLSGEQLEQLLVANYQ